MYMIIFFQSRMGDCQLDDLLDMLGEEDEECFAEAEAAALESLNSPKIKKSKESATSSTGSASEADPEKEALKKQLEEMQKQMMMIKSKLETGENQTPTVEKSVREVDMFSKPTNVSGEVKQLRSPVKTNPLTEAERPVRLAVYEPRTTDWCPSLIKTSTTRVITGEEAERLRQGRTRTEDQRKMAEIARSDLADSDDEELSAYGKDIQRGLSSRESGGAGVASQKTKPVQRAKPGGVMVERNSQIRVSSPLVSQQELEAAIRQRQFVGLSRLGTGAATNLCQGDWVTVAVLYLKHPPKTSANGNDFSTWKLTDLRGDITTVTLFLFGKAHKEHWKLPLNKVVGILNPKLMDDKGKKNDVSLSIDHPDKLLEIGDSPDLSSCDFVKQSGTKCSNIVNRSQCSYCVYHLKSAYKSHASSRSNLQSSYSGGGTNEAARARLMNKVSARGETIFAGGQILNNAPVVIGKKSAASRARDNQLLAGLGGPSTSSSSNIVKEVVNTGKYKGRPMGSMLSQEQKKVVASVSENVSEELGARLLAPTPGARAFLSTVCKEERKQEQLNNPIVKKTAKELLLEHKKMKSNTGPKLGRGLSTEGEVSLELSTAVRKSYSASQNKALAILKMKGEKLAKIDPNSLHRAKNRTPDIKNKVMKRIRSDEDDEENVEGNANKRAKTAKTVTVFGKEVKVEDLEAVRGKRTSNKQLVEEAELEAVDGYFLKAEARDAMEQKMLDTKSLKVKAVSCLICNYTDFKSSELCKSQGHKVKVVEAEKRFFSCKDCKARTVSLDRLPKKTCGRCGGSNWQRAGMISERSGPKLENELLSLRGNEEMFLGTTSGTINLNL